MFLHYRISRECMEHRVIWQARVLSECHQPSMSREKTITPDWLLNQLRVISFVRYFYHLSVWWQAYMRLQSDISKWLHLLETMEWRYAINQFHHHLELCSLSQFCYQCINHDKVHHRKSLQSLRMCSVEVHLIGVRTWSDMKLQQYRTVNDQLRQTCASVYKGVFF